MNEKLQELKEQERESTMQHANANKGVVELSNYVGADFQIEDCYQLHTLLFDTMLIKFEDGDADTKMKGGIHIPLTATSTQKAFRTGRVVLAGTGCKQCKVGDYVTFPNDRGLILKSIRVKGEGVVTECAFVAEDRIFGICEKVEDE